MSGVKMPRLLNKQLQEVGRLHPSSCSITLNMEPISTAKMSLPDGEETVSVGDFVELFVPGRSAGIFRVSAVDTDYVSGAQNVSLEHGIVTMADAVVFGHHHYYGFDDGGSPEYTVTAYMGVVGYYYQYQQRLSLILTTYNKDGSRYRPYFKIGTVIPIIARSESGYQMLLTSETNALADPELSSGKWDGNIRTVRIHSDAVWECLPYSNATATAVAKETMRLRPERSGSISGSQHVMQIGDHVTVHGRVGDEVGGWYSVEDAGYRGYVPTDSIVLDPGYIIGGVTGDVQKQFEAVGQSLIDAAHNQSTHWQFGESDFVESFGYTFDNVNLFDAMLSLPDKLQSPYMWEFDQSAEPWRLNLRKLHDKNLSELRMSRNLSALSTSVNVDDVVTCVFPVGADGLTIEAVNDGLPYILDEGKAEIYGHREAVIETQDTDASALYESGLRELEKHGEAQVSVKVSALELSRMTGEPLDALEIGKMCRIPLPEIGTTVEEYIVSMAWSNVYGAPERVNVTLANSSKTASGFIAKMMRG